MKRILHLKFQNWNFELALLSVLIIDSGLNNKLRKNNSPYNSKIKAWNKHNE